MTTKHFIPLIDEALEELENHLQEMLESVESIRSFGWAKRWEERPEDLGPQEVLQIASMEAGDKL